MNQDSQGLNVLSLFDGISCGQQALDRLGVKLNKYYASEIDKYAIIATKANYPNTIHVGDIRGLHERHDKPGCLYTSTANKCDLSEFGFPHRIEERIDLVIGGSPCQSFSFAGKRNGMSTKDSIEILTLEHYLELKKNGFEFEGQSYLFWEYMRILTTIKKYNPHVKFLLENVIMGAKWQKILSQAIGINPIEINSALVSAQNRRRLYWTNIGAESDGLFGDLVCKIPQPKDKGILLKDVLEPEVDEKYYLSDKMLNTIKKHGAYDNVDNDKCNCVLANYFKMGGRDQQYVVHNTMPHSSKTGKGGTGPLSRNDGKTYCLDTGQTNAIQIVAMRGRNPDNPKSRESGLKTEQILESRIPNDGKTNCITTVQKDNLVYTANNLQYHLTKHDADNRAYYEDGKQGTLDTKKERAKVLLNTNRIRRLTPLECCRLQTVKDDYFIKEGIQIISDTQQYKSLGNGWTVDVIAHIFSYL